MNLIDKIGGIEEAKRALYYRALGATHVGNPPEARDFVYYQMGSNGFLYVEALSHRQPWPDKTAISDLVNHYDWTAMYGSYSIPHDAISLEDLAQELLLLTTQHQKQTLTHRE